MEKEIPFGGKRIIVALSKKVDAEYYDFDNPEIEVFEFNDQDKFNKYITSDFINEIAEKCNADWLGDFEEQTLFPSALPTAIKIMSKAIEQNKNEDFVDYLEKTKEFMEKALANDTFMEFSF